jgi:hypothetical protein
MSNHQVVILDIQDDKEGFFFYSFLPNILWASSPVPTFSPDLLFVYKEEVIETSELNINFCLSVCMRKGTRSEGSP